MRRLIFVLLSVIVLVSCNKQTHKGIAVVIDTKSYEHIKQQLDDYKQTLEDEGFIVYTLVKDYELPDSLRNDLIKLYNSDKPIEGAVLIGDIPIAMISDAQHMTTAFKMNQKRFGLEQSSVPSDRFYDDFDLSFDYIKSDTANSLLHYYSLSYNSAQHLHPNIYTGRIKPPKTSNRYELLKKYMQKVVRQHRKQNGVDNILFFAGHGYISESMVARMDEKISLMQQFLPNTTIDFINHDAEEFIKSTFVQAMANDKLDIAICHHHGSENTQYFSAWLSTSNYQKQIEQAKRYFRSKLEYRMRKGKDADKYKQKMMKKYGINESWFALKTQEDSIYNAKLDLTIDDFAYYRPNAKFVVLDACYNGAFQNDRYISGEYIFSEGNTIAVQANSVNVLQDKWSNHLLGLLALGMPVGEWNKQIGFLESHIIGDPTFHFYNANTFDYNNLSVSELKNILKSSNAELQAFALKLLFDKQYEDISNLLLQTYKTSNYYNVRAECLYLSSQINDDNYIQLLQLALFDNHEFVQRMAVKMCGKSGNEELIPSLVNMAFCNLSKRVAFNYVSALSFFNKEKLKQEFKTQLQQDSVYFLTKENSDIIFQVFDKSDNIYNLTVKHITDTAASDKRKLSSIRTLRNYNFHKSVADYISFVKDTTNKDLHKPMLEALGWFNLSYKKQDIVNMCNEIINDTITYNNTTRQEASRTLLRLTNN